MKGLKPFLALVVGTLVCAILIGCVGKAPANGPAALNVAEFTLQGAAINIPYRQLLVASGGVTPYTWTISSGSLPPGLSVTSDGILSGTPTTAGTYYFAVQVTDSQQPVHAIDTAAESITVNQDLSLTASSLGNGVVSTAFTANVQAANGVAPYSYSIASGNLPDGLTLTTVQPTMTTQQNPGNISGMPTTAGTFTFTIQATDSINETATAEYTIIVVGRLAGPYILPFSGFDSSQPAGSQAFYGVAQLTAANDQNGSGTLTGTLDQVGPGSSSGSNVTVTGTYNLPSGTNIGSLTFTRADNNASYQFNIALSSVADSKVILANPNAPQVYGSGLLKKQTATTIANGGNFAFGLFGNNSGGNRYAAAGMFALNTALAVTGGAEDINDNGNIPGEQYISGGSFNNNTNPNTGRGTATLNLGTKSTYNYTYYIVSSGEIVAVDTDTGGPQALVDMVSQQSAGVSGGTVLCQQGSNCQAVLELDGLSTSAQPEAEIGVASFTGCSGTPCAGTFTRTDNLPTYYLDQNVGGTYNSISYTGGTYSIDGSCGMISTACGRVTVNITGISTQPVWYLYNSGQGFVVGTDPDVTQGTLQPQSGAPFTIAALLGSYLGGTISPVSPSIANEIDVAGTPPPGGTWSVIFDLSGPNLQATNQAWSLPYILDPTYGAAFGKFDVTNSATPPQTILILYPLGSGTIGATGGKVGFGGLNIGAPQADGSVVPDPNPRLSTYGR